MILLIIMITVVIATTVSVAIVDTSLLHLLSNTHMDATGVIFAICVNLIALCVIWWFSIEAREMIIHHRKTGVWR